MYKVIFYTLLSVMIVSLVSLVGVITLFFKEQKLDKVLMLLVSLSAGSLLGSAFFHLLPEKMKEQGGELGISVSLSVLGGFLLFFGLEKFVHWRHCHVLPHKAHPHHLAVMNLVGDGVHNFMDGLVISVSYLVSVPAGIATTLAVVLHEVPQEIGDFGILLYSGVSKIKALFLNFLSALVAVVGAIVGLVLGASSQQFVSWILPFAAGGFLYIAGTDLIPELHKGCGCKETFWKESVMHFLAMVLGMGLMLALKFVE